ncbi:MAG: carboxylesterase family protein [Microbacterium sp.]
MRSPVFLAPCGRIRGWRDGAVIRATGIPYASAPRFGIPEPTPNHTGTFDATAWAPAAPQLAVPALEQRLGYSTADLVQDEHCQRLSVTIPARSSSPLPVMVWIHGGAYTSGAADIPIHDPAALVAEQNVIVVGVTYRLGLLGYLGGAEERPANLGLMDQLCALRWVQRNIAAFGGDRDNITVFGESAGGDAVLHLMATPEAPRLFRRAIAQSAPLGLSRGRQKMNAAMLAATKEATPATSLEDILTLQETAQNAAAGFGLRSTMAFGTQYGHTPLPAETEVQDAWAAAALAVDLLIGFNADEVRFFIDAVPALVKLSRVPVIGRALTGAVARLLTEVIYARGARDFARRHRRAGGTVRSYVIRWSAPGNPFGASHTIDLPLLFANAHTWRDAEITRGADADSLTAAARRIRVLWADFARGEDIGGRSIEGLIDVS